MVGGGGWIKDALALQLRQIPVLGIIALGRVFDELEKVAQVFAFGVLKLGKFDPHSERWTAVGNNSSQDEAFDPDFSVGQSKTDFYVHS